MKSLSVTTKIEATEEIVQVQVNMVRTTSDKQNSRTFQGLFKEKN